MKSIRCVIALICFVAPLVTVGAAQAGTVELTMSNFRFCQAETCGPTDQGYVRTSSGPVDGTNNSQAIVDVPSGSTVTWVYRDNGPISCDAFGEDCAGHDVRFEDGTAAGAKKGFAAARSGETKVTTQITGQPDTLVRYFCAVNNHYQTGMTGILRVVAAEATDQGSDDQDAAQDNGDVAPVALPHTGPGLSTSLAGLGLLLLAGALGFLGRFGARRLRRGNR